uniref:UBA domain-containing protein n=1 Tax=Rhabditophanes sp. KR3021 TaxID=114890 RepID=A0AC35UDS4_9BILA
MNILFRTLTHKSLVVPINGPTPAKTIFGLLDGMFPPLGDIFDGVEQSLVYAGKVYRDADIFDPSIVNSEKFVLFFQMGTDKDDDDSQESESSSEDEHDELQDHVQFMEVEDMTPEEVQAMEQGNVTGVGENVNSDIISMMNDEHYLNDLEITGFTSGSSDESSDDESMSDSENDETMDVDMINISDDGSEQNDDEEAEEDDALSVYTVDSINTFGSYVDSENTDGTDDPNGYLESDTFYIQEPDPTPAEGTEEADGFGAEEIHKIENESDIKSVTKSTIGLGFMKEDVEKALKLSNNDSEYAINLLIANCYNDTDDEEDINALIPNLSVHENKTDSLIASPYFQDLASIIQKNPRMLRAYIATVAKVSPEMIKSIKEYEDIFLNLLNKPTRTGDDSDRYNRDESDDMNFFDMEVDSFPHEFNPESLGVFLRGGNILRGPHNRAINIDSLGRLRSDSLTEQDLRVVGAIVEMGFERERVIRTYISHYRSEIATVNALLEDPEDV